MVTAKHTIIALVEDKPGVLNRMATLFRRRSFKVRATSSTRSEIIEIVDIFRASIVDVASDSVTIEVTGDEEKIDSLLSLLRGFGIKEITRTGRIAMVRGNAGSLPAAQRASMTGNKTRKAP